jgi:hypothetical protein
MRPQAFHNFIEGAIQAELPMLRRFNTIFDTIGAASPLLDLLGTVLGSLPWQKTCKNLRIRENRQKLHLN